MIFWRILKEIGIFDFFDGKIHVDTVKEGAGEFLLIAIDVGRTAFTWVGGVAKIATRAGIHGGNEHKISRVGGLLVSA